MQLVQTLHLQRGGGSHLGWGTRHSHALMREVQDRHADKLPMWPPPLRRGTKVRIDGLQSRPELNDEAKSRAELAFGGAHHAALTFHNVNIPKGAKLRW